MAKINPKPAASSSIKDSTKPGGAKISGQAAERCGDVLVKLEGLRVTTRAVSRAYTANVERDILEIADLVDALRRPKGRGRKNNALAIENIMEVLDGLCFKPERGRRRDLKKIELAVQAIRRILSKKEKIRR